MKPTVISLCDKTGNALKPWAEAGYLCYAVDVQHSIRRDRREGNIVYVWGDARSWTPPTGCRLVFGMAWPPCTHVAGSGARDWKIKGQRCLTDALDLFNSCHHALSWAGVPFMIENPVGALTKHFRKPDHYFDPCEYAGYLADPAPEAYTKKTCLWTGGGFVMSPPKAVFPTLGSKMHGLTPSDDRQDERSVTPQGFARAVFEANHPRIAAVA